MNKKQAETEQRVIHKPVLLKKILEYLEIKPDGVYVDCTLGDGGYSIEILRKLSPDGTLVSIDLDQDSIDFVTSRYKVKLKSGNWHLVKGNFRDIKEIINDLKLKKVDGIVYDLGMSSRQIDNGLRGFSYLRNEVLDMRMDKSLGVRATDLLKVAGAKQLEKIIQEYGEERFAKRIARGVKHWLNENDYKDMTSGELVEIIRKNVPAGYRKGSKHPARRTFQALRIAVNDELLSLSQGLNSALSLAKRGCTVVVVSYHSLEDRIVKNVFSEWETKGEVEVITRKPEVPEKTEIESNPRARSAKLRAVRKN
ncbi:16S rRNA (cytosine(1402)-N(4))-methyltransferase RsmH [Candidatus Dojkabacteria bacterium]|nr:16S rRNA (cytosine(1402)-N(4))-methyltransferase RsmH [Candidatus Dojkabacteria bacterium]